MSAQSPAKVTHAGKAAKPAKAAPPAKAASSPKPAAAAKGTKGAKGEKLAAGTSTAKTTKTAKAAKMAKTAKATANPGKRAPQRAKRLGEEGPVDLEAFARNKDTKKLKQRAEAPETWQLRLYVAGKTPKSIEAFRNLQQICEEHLKGRYQIEVIDLLTNPTLARGDQILALPTVVRQLPPPVKKVIGNFTSTERVLVGLDIRPLSASTNRTSSPTGEAP